MIQNDSDLGIGENLNTAGNTETVPTAAKTFLRTNLHRLRDSLNGWPVVAGLAGVAVPTLYAWANLGIDKRPSLERTIRLGVLDASVNGKDRVDTCRQWLLALGYSVPADIEIAISGPIKDLPAHVQWLIELIPVVRDMPEFLCGISNWLLAAYSAQHGIATERDRHLTDYPDLKTLLIWEWNDATKRRFDSHHGFAQYVRSHILPEASIRDRWPKDFNKPRTEFALHMCADGDSSYNEISQAFWGALPEEMFPGDGLDRVSLWVSQHTHVHVADLLCYETCDQEYVGYLIQPESVQLWNRIVWSNIPGYADKPYLWTSGAIPLGTERMLRILKEYGVFPSRSARSWANLPRKK